MPIVLKPASLHIKDENGNYITHNVLTISGSDGSKNTQTTENSNQSSNAQGN